MQIKNLVHKIQFWKLNLKEIFISYGLPFVIIIIGWEIVEDILFPILMFLLGRFVHPLFYGLIPASWFMCLHPIVVPILFGFWCHFFGGEKS